MAIYNLGSINIDHFYRVAHLPRPGETVTASAYAAGLGGKGLNQSLAAAAAGARVHHIGAVGEDGRWAVDRLAAAGVETGDIATLPVVTGHAVILVDPAGENLIAVHAGANGAVELGALRRALTAAGEGDWFLTQNETALVAEGLELARARGLRTAFSPAPFETELAASVLGSVDLLAVNEVEAEQLSRHLGVEIEDVPVPALLVTKGERGAEYHSGGEIIAVAAFEVEAVDTTGAGDVFLGYFLAALDRGERPEFALREAAAAAAIQVTRAGAAEAIPTRAEVEALLAARGAAASRR